ncbi:signal peptidase I [Sphingomonas canadensis]|uniref:Signal peptidase I n=1 Tax=Sphingomonas canadensis TaxID=1219257 RepID=A0ABW3H028_9SPHN|nr:signal peptidase I [Sphingomonas canadensis]MCW3835302.1 signal peptidase I [Sphingomonas canadensis]
MDDEQKTSPWRSAVGWALLVLGIFLFQSAAARRMYIPSGSMMPTLLKGDQLIVSKYPYGWSYASLAIHPATVIPGKLFGRLPERGDIVTVARRGDGADLIKRVIGLPGDRIEVRQGRLILNGAVVRRVPVGAAALPVDENLPCDEPRLARFRLAGPDGKLYCRLPLFRETLPNGVSYDTVDLTADAADPSQQSFGDNYGPVTVPDGHVFLMGDNRDASADSRFPLDNLGLGGPVPVETISGRAELITHSYDGTGSWLNPISWFTTTREGRSWTSLRPEKAGK